MWAGAPDCRRLLHEGIEAGLVVHVATSDGFEKAVPVVAYDYRAKREARIQTNGHLLLFTDRSGGVLVQDWQLAQALTAGRFDASEMQCRDLTRHLPRVGGAVEEVSTAITYGDGLRGMGRVISDLCSDGYRSAGQQVSMLCAVEDGAFGETLKAPFLDQELQGLFSPVKAGYLWPYGRDEQNWGAGRQFCGFYVPGANPGELICVGHEDGKDGPIPSLDVIGTAVVVYASGTKTPALTIRDCVTESADVIWADRAPDAGDWACIRSGGIITFFIREEGRWGVHRIDGVGRLLPIEEAASLYEAEAMAAEKGEYFADAPTGGAAGAVGDPAEVN